MSRIYNPDRPRSNMLVVVDSTGRTVIKTKDLRTAVRTLKALTGDATLFVDRRPMAGRLHGELWMGGNLGKTLSKRLGA